jgi:hypothetical protein
MCIVHDLIWYHNVFLFRVYQDSLDHPVHLAQQDQERQFEAPLDHQDHLGFLEQEEVEVG